MCQVGRAKDDNYQPWICNLKNKKCSEKDEAIVKGIQVMVAELAQRGAGFCSFCLHSIQVVANQV